jgi:hypothetical protein
MGCATRSIRIMWNNEPPATMPTGSQAKTGCLFFILANRLCVIGCVLAVELVHRLKEVGIWPTGRWHASRLIRFERVKDDSSLI